MATVIDSFQIKLDMSEATQALNELTIAAIKAQEAIAKLGDICLSVDTDK